MNEDVLTLFWRTKMNEEERTLFWRTKMNEEELKAIARDAVMKTDEQYDYLPKRADAVAVFEPHRWVLMAMNSAHEQGYIKGMEMTRKLMRLRLGLGTREDEC